VDFKENKEKNPNGKVFIRVSFRPDG